MPFEFDALSFLLGVVPAGVLMVWALSGVRARAKRAEAERDELKALLSEANQKLAEAVKAEQKLREEARKAKKILANLVASIDRLNSEAE